MQSQKKRNFSKFLYFGIAGGVSETVSLDNFHTDLRAGLKDIAETISPSNRAFVEESTSGTFLDFSFGARIIQTSKIYLEADFSYLLATTKSANSQITGSSRANKLIDINHQFKEQQFVAHLTVFKPISPSFHLGAGLGIGYGKAELILEGDTTPLGGSVTRNEFKGDGTVVEYIGHLKYAPSRLDYFSILLNIGLRSFRPDELKNTRGKQVLTDRFGKPLDFHFFSLFTSLEARFQF